MEEMYPINDRATMEAHNDKEKSVDLKFDESQFSFTLEMYAFEDMHDYLDCVEKKKRGKHLIKKDKSSIHELEVFMHNLYSNKGPPDYFKRQVESLNTTGSNHVPVGSQGYAGFGLCLITEVNKPGVEDEKDRDIEWLFAISKTQQHGQPQPTQPNPGPTPTPGGSNGGGNGGGQQTPEEAEAGKEGEAFVADEKDIKRLLDFLKQYSKQTLGTLVEYLNKLIAELKEARTKGVFEKPAAIQKDAKDIESVINSKYLKDLSDTYDKLDTEILAKIDKTKTDCTKLYKSLKALKSYKSDKTIQERIDRLAKGMLTDLDKLKDDEKIVKENFEKIKKELKDAFELLKNSKGKGQDDAIYKSEGYLEGAKHCASVIITKLDEIEKFEGELDIWTDVLKQELERLKIKKK